MIRLVQAVRRRPDVTHADFTAYWRDEHGPLVASHQARLNVLRHVQTHADPRLEALAASFRELRGGMEPPYDGLQETWWPSEAALRAALESEPGRRAHRELVSDEASFIDPSTSTLWLAHEYPQVSTSRERIVARPRTGVARLVFALRQPGALSRDEAQHYWLTEHGPLLRAHAVARGMLCYQQVHAYAGPLTDRLRGERGITSELHIGLAEAWIDASVPRGGADVEAAAEVARADETNFVDWSRSTALVGRELVLVDRDHGWASVELDATARADRGA